MTLAIYELDHLTISSFTAIFQVQISYCHISYVLYVRILIPPFWISTMGFSTTSLDQPISRKYYLEAVDKYQRLLESEDQRTFGRACRERIRRGHKCLTSLEECDIYDCFYGGYFFETLLKVYYRCDHPHVPMLKHEFFNNYQVIDWGCGQMNGSLSLLEFIESQGLSTYPQKIIGIDASPISSGRGQGRINQFSEERILGINTKIVVQDLNTISNNFIQEISECGLNTLHLMYNILDVDNFEIEGLANKIRTYFRGNQVFICLSPLKFQGINRMTRFVNQMNAIKENVVLPTLCSGKSMVYLYSKNQWGMEHCNVKVSKFYLKR